MTGVVLKIGFDSLSARRTSNKEGLERFATERRQAYENFLASVAHQREYVSALRELLEAHKEGRREISEEEQAAFPRSPMADLVLALEEVRRLARLFSIITSAEAIVRLFADMAAASKAELERLGPNDEITWFLLQRFLEDRISEFTHGYREDLGLGSPLGGPKGWPMVKRERPWSADESEQLLRLHMPRKTGASRTADDDASTEPGG